MVKEDELLIVNLKSRRDKVMKWDFINVITQRNVYFGFKKIHMATIPEIK